MAWFPVLLRYGGLVGGLIFVPVVWLLTNRLEPALIAFFTTMLMGGEGLDALRDYRSSRPVSPDLDALPARPPDSSSR